MSDTADKIPVYTTDEHEDESGKFVASERINIKTDLITITHDKLENILIKHLYKIFQKNMWITPFSLFISIIATILTATFKDSLGISKEIWAALFYILLVGSFIWLFISLVLLCKNYKESTIEYLILKIKNIDKSKTTA